MRQLVPYLASFLPEWVGLATLLRQRACRHTHAHGILSLSGRDRPVFASKVTQPWSKATEDSASRLASHRWTLAGDRLGHDPLEQALFFQSRIPATLKPLARRTSSLAGSAHASDHEQGVTTKTLVQETPRSGSWDFSKIPLFSPERGSGDQPSSVRSAPSVVLRSAPMLQRRAPNILQRKAGQRCRTYDGIPPL